MIFFLVFILNMPVLFMMAETSSCEALESAKGSGYFFKQILGYNIDSGICTLGTEDGGSEKLKRGLIVKRADHHGVFFLEELLKYLGTFFF